MGAFPTVNSFGLEQEDAVDEGVDGGEGRGQDRAENVVARVSSGLTPFLPSLQK